MTAEGFFHDAHEVYVPSPTGAIWRATFASKELAHQWVEFQQTQIPGMRFEVRPV